MDIEYYDLLKESLDGDILRNIAERSGITVIDLINTRSQVFKKLDMDIGLMTEEEALDLMIKNPRIIIRPILLHNNKVIFRFSVDEYKEKLSS